MIQNLLAKMLGKYRGLAARGGAADAIVESARFGGQGFPHCMRETGVWPRERFGGNGVVPDYNVNRVFADTDQGIKWWRP